MIASTLLMRLQVQNSTQKGRLSRVGDLLGAPQFFTPLPGQAQGIAPIGVNGSGGPGEDPWLSGIGFSDAGSRGCAPGGVSGVSPDLSPPPAPEGGAQKNLYLKEDPWTPVRQGDAFKLTPMGIALWLVDLLNSGINYCPLLPLLPLFASIVGIVVIVIVIAVGVVVIITVGIVVVVIISRLHTGLLGFLAIQDPVAVFTVPLQAIYIRDTLLVDVSWKIELIFLCGQSQCLAIQRWTGNVIDGAIAMATDILHNAMPDWTGTSNTSRVILHRIVIGIASPNSHYSARCIADRPVVNEQIGRTSFRSDIMSTTW